ncbi:uncharacterized protein LOC129310873 [Prosopis cineraria]|uniref:uncharacterized protein LOC129310873 n=1 Tax=Prosopis cineraria TaxID=364024 RepID=UPI00240EAA72|nr:uncharacterized protein LOC129310873 [Prosopis cineraria]
MTTKVYVSEVEKLKAELREKTESFKDLKKSHDAQVDEINEAKLMHEDLRRDLENKESMIKHISSANDKLRETYEERLRTLEDEKRSLVSALEEAKEAACLSIHRKKSLEAEKSLRAANEDEKFKKLLVQENRMKEEQVTWKKEQLENLEEAHVEQQAEISPNEDPELETYTLLDDISSLQMKLHFQTKTLERLEHEFRMSKQALTHEESIKKQLENQLSESLDSSIIELKLENEELSVTLLVLQQAISEAQAMDKDDSNNEEIELEMYKEKLEEACDALDKAVIELDELIYEGNELECEVETWKLACERLKNDLEESHAKRKELEASLLAQVVFGESLKQERRIDVQKVKEAESEKVKILEIIKEKDKILKVLQKEIKWLEQEAFRREFESAVMVKGLTERTNNHVKDKLM